MNDKKTAAILYNGQSSAATPPTASPHPATDVAAKLYDNADREQSPATRQSVTQYREDLGIIVGLTQDEQKDFVNEVYDATEQAGFSEHHSLNRLLLDRRVVIERTTARGTATVDPQRAQDDRERSRAAIRAAFPQDDPDEMLDRANRFLLKQPKLHAVIEAAGATCDPEVVLPLLRHVRAVNFR